MRLEISLLHATIENFILIFINDVLCIADAFKGFKGLFNKQLFDHHVCSKYN